MGRMAKVFFTSHLRHVAPAGAVESAGQSVRAVLQDVFARYPAARGYVLDDQGRVRLHIAIFVDGVQVRKNVLDYPLKADSELYIMQALSGG
jgi:molybdopterin synthase sulfur carrier subunit